MANVLFLLLRAFLRYGKAPLYGCAVKPNAGCLLHKKKRNNFVKNTTCSIFARLLNCYIGLRAPAMPLCTPCMA
jgi:hypothetical protein